jgi:hypothetical protein
MGETVADPAEAPPALSAEEAEAIIGAAIDRYIAGRYRRLPGFIDENFGFAGSLRLHRLALGADLLRAPANVALVFPHLAGQVAGAGLERMGMRQPARWLKTRRLFFETDVGRELVWRLHTRLLELPFDDGRRRSEHDALAAEILAAPELAAMLEQVAVLRHREDTAVRQRIGRIIETYAGTRNATAEIVNNALLAGTGLAALHQLTPGALSLGPALAGVLAQQAAIAGFPLGATLGGLWYGVFAAAPSAGLVVGMTGGLVLATAAVAPFAGVVADPLQRAMGLHRRRLRRLIETLARELKGEGDAALKLRDHYVARLFDVVDLIRATMNALR